MESDKRAKPYEQGKDRIEEVANTLEWLITAFILAFVFRAFVMEAFRIPTGSMADTLMGAHHRLRCLQCGYEYEYGYSTEPEKDIVPPGPENLEKTRCPSCGFIDGTGRPHIVSNGDRLLVLKCIYQFIEPKRWDVVVFKNPLKPQINYIKRMIAKPFEKVEIIDGDIYINDKIARKPPQVQEELWMPVYMNDYQPARPREGSFNGRPWRNPFITTGSRWTINPENPVLFHLDSPADQINSMVYNTKLGNDFRCTYAYNDINFYRDLPTVSDIMVSYYASQTEKEWGVGAILSKYGATFRAWVDFTGSMNIFYSTGPVEILLASSKFEAVLSSRPARIRFANVDHQLIFEYNNQTLTFDLDSDPGILGERKTGVEPRVEIIGSGKVTLSHVGIFRDIYYTDRSFNGSKALRATEGNPPLILQKDQFFVLGDNSPNSEDGRFWDSNGVGNNQINYDKGIVPKDYLVGKAVFVYWPAGFRPSFGQNYFPFAIIPNVGRMRFVAGG